ncbi:hypothetical protein MVEN_00508200 [Mycena venus]|uniref:Uncharacterized protein n=1 Tax=Mycena venus TaxID=2733690 RepID=A0A8H7D7G6_9AGAR|nr:hypothetical protein MVEN_00508200 [Mycena venus]
MARVVDQPKDVKSPQGPPAIPAMNPGPSYVAHAGSSSSPNPVVYHYDNPITGEHVASLLPPNHPEMICLQAGEHVPYTNYGLLGSPSVWVCASSTAESSAVAVDALLKTASALERLGSWTFVYTIVCYRFLLNMTVGLAELYARLRHRTGHVDTAVRITAPTERATAAL